MSDAVRVLLLADTHLGFDLPVRPRVERRRRGHDFLANYQAALAPALAGEVDIVVHGGDVFDRSSVIHTLAYQAFEPLRGVAERGIPVFIVPGNHERSRLPHLRFAAHPNIHVFAGPRTFATDVRGMRVAVSGFPYERGVRARFADALRDTAWEREPADLRLLCIHHCVEGATVGPADYTFTTADDVIRIRDIPREFAAVLSGHIHRHQVLTTDLKRRPVDVPVLYPGSIERTATAEIGEPKGYVVLHAGHCGSERTVRWEFRELPARPMIRRELAVDGMDAPALAAAVDAILMAAPADAVLSIRVVGPLTSAHWRVVSQTRLRSVAPSTMNVDIVPDEPPGRRARQPVDPQATADQWSLEIG
jgi:exonuclease SbcD